MDTIDRLLNSIRHDAAVRQVLVGAFWTAVVVDGDPPQGGIASALRAETGGPWPPVRRPGILHEWGGRELAHLLRSERILEASIGMAAFNALLDVDVQALTEVNAEQIILDQGPDKRVAIVGHFPFIDRVRAAVAQCWVLELRPGPDDLPADQAAEILPQADVVALTGTSLLNHSFDELIALCRPDAYVLLLGPSAPLTPVLFDAGVDAICGTRIIDAERVLYTLSQGANFRQIKRGGGLKLLTMFNH